MHVRSDHVRRLELLVGGQDVEHARLSSIDDALHFGVDVWHFGFPQVACFGDVKAYDRQRRRLTQFGLPFNLKCKPPQVGVAAYPASAVVSPPFAARIWSIDRVRRRVFFWERGGQALGHGVAWGPG